MIGIRSAFSIRARGQWPHLEAVYMTAPRSLAEAPRKSLPRGGRPYMTGCLTIESRTGDELPCCRRSRQIARQNRLAHFLVVAVAGLQLPVDRMQFAQAALKT